MRFPQYINRVDNKTMKLWIKLIFLLSLLFLPKLWAQGVAPTNQEILDNEETGGRGKFYATGVTEEKPKEGSTQMERVSEQVKGVKEAYKFCVNEKETTNKGDPDFKVEECLWKKLDANSKKEVMNYLDEEKEALKEDSKMKTASTGTFRQTQDKTTRKLQEYLKKRLQETLYDSTQEKGVKILSDHGTFYDIYKSQIGQNVTRVTSDVCMYAFPSGKLPEESLTGDLAIKNKARNMKNLAIPSTNPEFLGKPEAYETFSKCLTDIPKNCKRGNNHACKVLAYMEEANKGIKDIDDVNKELKEFHGDSQNKTFETVVSKEKTNNEKEIAKVSLIASGEIKEAELKEVAEEEAKILEECALNEGKSADCDLYLTDSESKEDIEIEFMIREKAKEEKIKESLDKSSDEDEAVTAVLEEEGLSEEQIARYLASTPKDGSNVDISHAKDIKLRYENKRIAVIEELNERIKAKQSTADGAAPDPTKTSATFESMRVIAKSRTKDLEQSIHFANVVTSFIQVGDDGNTNTNALANELNNSTFQDSAASIDAGLGPGHNKLLEATLQAAPNKSPDDQLPNLESKTLERIIYQLPEETK
jgi:hypothetical protein